jgi:cytochrome b6-f complex iron-sulfur subunit
MVALIAPGALVAACSTSEPSGSSNTTTEGGTTAPGGSATGLTALADVPDGGGVIVDNPNGGVLLIVRNGDQVKAFNAACTHMGTTVEAPKNGVSTCPNHGSQFSAETGAVEKGPATQPLPSVSVKVDGAQVVLA